MSLIDSVHARQILDSRGNPTVEVDVWLDDGAFGRAAVPCGASTGEHEALELRDGDDARSAARASAPRSRNVRERSDRQSRGMDALDQRGLDGALLDLDGTRGQVGAGRERGARRLARRRACRGRLAPGSRCIATSAARARTSCRRRC